MSYDIVLKTEDGEIFHFPEPQDFKGGSYAIGGTTEAWLNITYNYGKHYYRVMGEKGIRSIYGLTGEESLPILESAISQLGDDISKDYWEPTEGNAKAALVQLKALAEAAPNCIWDGD